MMNSSKIIPYNLPEKCFETLQRLLQLIDDQIEDERNLITYAEAAGLDLGQNPKPRINYLVSLGILRLPKPVIRGKGKGGTRLLQRDVIDILEFVNEQNKTLPFNDIADLVRERREDLFKKACQEVGVDIEDNGWFQDVPFKDILTYKRFFRYDLILAGVLSWFLYFLAQEKLPTVNSEISAIESLRHEIGETFCDKDKGKLDDFIQMKKEQQDALKKRIKKVTLLARTLIEKIEDDEMNV